MSEVKHRGDTSEVERTGYKGFGSFHSDNLEELLQSATALGYNPPRLPFEWDEIRDTEIPEFGHPCKELFLLDSEWTFINHGAFGCTARYPFDLAQRWRIYIERQPLRGLDRELFPHIVNSMRLLGSFLNADLCDFVLVTNATTALSTVIRCVGSRLTSEDGIYALDIGYGAVKKLLRTISNSTGATFKEGNINLSHRQHPLDDSELLSLVENDIPRNTKLIVFDHVASNSSIVLPVVQLSNLCKKVIGEEVVIVIDGAHGPLNLPLNFGGRTDDGRETENKPCFDYYVGNLHKWFSNNKGSAFLWSRRGSQTTATTTNHDKGDVIHSLFVSHGYGEGFASEFTWSGLQDYSAFLSIPQTLNLWETVGAERVRRYTHRLAREAAEMLRVCWQIDDLPISKQMQSSMALIPLPTKHASETSVEAKYIQDRLHYEHKIEVPIKCINDKLYVRISAHIYNQISDYQRLAMALLSIRGISPPLPQSLPSAVTTQEKKKSVRERSLNLRLMPQTYSVCKLSKKENSLPSWALTALDRENSNFFSVTRTEDELSIVCPQGDVPSVDEDLKREDNWRCFKVEGPLDFSLTGIMSSLVSPLAQHNVSVFPVSTFDTDYLLIPSASLSSASTILKDCGHNVFHNKQQ